LPQRALLHVEPLARRLNQALDLGRAEELRQWARPARALDRERRVVAPPAFGTEKLVELTDRGEAARQRRGAELPRPTRGEESANMSCVRLKGVGALGAEIGFVVGEIAAVGVDRIGAPAALRGERLEEAHDMGNPPRLHPAYSSSNRVGSGPSRRGSGRPRWRKACGVRTRPRGVRCTRPIWIR